MARDELKTEWCLLQNQFDSYEKHSLYIKLLSVIVLPLLLIIDVTGFIGTALLMALWLQDGIWKTFQARIEVRLIQLETALSEHTDMMAYQFNSEFQSSRSGILSLVKEYVSQSLRPTVAYPHVVLVLLSLGFAA